jgi:hypothetical protein
MYNKLRIWQFQRRGEYVLMWPYHHTENSACPIELYDMSYPDYENAYNLLLKLLRENRVRIVQNGVFVSTAPVGKETVWAPEAAWRRESNYPEHMKDGYFYFTLKDACRGTFFEDLKESVGLTHWRTFINTSGWVKETYEKCIEFYKDLEQDAIRRKEAEKIQQAKAIEIANMRYKEEHEPKVKIKFRRVEGACRFCGTVYSMELNGFAPGCPNCGAVLANEMNIQYT